MGPWARGDRAAREVHRKGGYPSTLPRVGAKRTEPGRPAPSRPPRRVGGGKRPPLLPRGESILGAALAALLGGGLLVLLVFLLLRDWNAGGPVVVRKRGKMAPPGREPVSSPGGGEEEVLPGDPDALAERGRYDLAVAALLVRALEKTGWSRAGRARSLTAREVLGGLSREDPRREILAAILGPAEAVRFGGRPATAELYGELRARFLELDRPVEAAEGGPPGREGP